MCRQRVFVCFRYLFGIGYVKYCKQRPWRGHVLLMKVNNRFVVVIFLVLFLDVITEPLMQTCTE